VAVTSRRGQVRIRARLTRTCPRGMVFVPFHFSENMINLLTNPAMDPIAKTPEFKICAVTVEKIP
jgi:predicted molibdopterin-dependent oxidoreductase YjgC